MIFRTFVIVVTCFGVSLALYTISRRESDLNRMNWQRWQDVTIPQQDRNGYIDAADYHDKLYWAVWKARVALKGRLP